MFSSDTQLMLEAVCEKPHFWTLRDVLADALEESGEQEFAECQRYMREWGIYALGINIDHISGTITKRKVQKYDYYNSREIPKTGQKRFEIITAYAWYATATIIFQKTEIAGRGWKLVRYPLWHNLEDYYSLLAIVKVYPTRMESEIALMKAWKKAVKDGWYPIYSEVS